MSVATSVILHGIAEQEGVEAVVVEAAGLLLLADHPLDTLHVLEVVHPTDDDLLLDTAAEAAVVK
eukprot:CAMPEP_0196600168 /NCGR_PEP_ID=MMETSP1081-20130531/95243_1 /TAXON_ID=36882 /ORGANISM="Pyramimonas amylifera, Strain CCMP720" /LENGTH=64 /DNA_ID=CAMNT_0041925985 /DNA_START=675 /DNA_END=869 /DNA_ORIENTATION=+